MKIYAEKDVDTGRLAGKRVAVLGYGSQGRAHALNLRDSGHDVVVGLRRGGATWNQARGDGCEVLAPADAVAGAGLVAMLVPDMAQPALYREVGEKLSKNSTLLFAHGFNVHYGEIKPRADLDVVLIAPKGPGSLVRRQFEQGKGVPCLMAIAQDKSGHAKATALAYAHGIGGSRGGVLETTFAEETETDLFGEQAVLCGGLTELITAGYDTLVKAGYQPEVAYFECMHEVKLIVDLLHEGGIRKMHQFISETAKYGDLTRGPRVVDQHTRARMAEILDDIRKGVFAREWIRENANGRPEYDRLLQADLAHPIERIGAELRARMSWLSEGKS
jgi:ketol-acid reductoisomerase